ncbi:tol-pal system protein YbgF [Pelagibacterium lentulum]|uniref:Cell division coordinator CpoB n=1 Tax=Pelagibacterium lentulum TaxID=2029865 RepID=A0A916RHM5_9HYPH|nr:tol-pal system protein YbgF [Pelagibacterium lentulum]GGA57879.1 tol-pal system protein YbgF [Pelagibacterium lentulum]
MSNSAVSVLANWRRPAAVLAAAGVLSVALALPGQGQSSDIAALQVRIDQLEEQVRIYTGQMEGMQFQLTQLQTLLERIQEDNEYRFQQLEGGGLGETEAVTSNGGAMPTEVLPPETQSSEQIMTGPISSGEPVLVGDEDILGEDTYIGTDDDLYASQVYGPDGVVLGPPEGPLGSTAPSTPLDFSFDPNGEMPSQGDANAQYQAGYEAIVRGERAFAEDQFRQFVASYPDHGQAPDATYWLGDSLIERGAYDEAADVLLTGFERYPTSTRAPDILLKLGVALHGAGEFDTACRTYGEVLRRYPDSTEAFRDRVVAEQVRAGC